MKPRVAVVDYGIGNLLSVCRALEYVGAEVTPTREAGEIETADRVVLPGVGAFADCTAALHRYGLFDVVGQAARSGRPFLGICVGMQMLFEGSEEFGRHEGYGIIRGRVTPVPPISSDGTPHKIPHIAWTGLTCSEGAEWKGTILEGIDPGASVYFVHSYTGLAANEDDRLADSDYDGQLIGAAVRRGQAFGTQYHPEKSGDVGLAQLGNFLKL